jgi:hypothetical protein
MGKNDMFGDGQDGLAPGKVFNAVPFAGFSAPAELALKIIALKLCLMTF